MMTTHAASTYCTTNEFNVRVSTHAHQSLDHGRSLDAKVLDGLEDIDQPLSHHPLQHNVQCNEYTTAANAIAAVKIIK